jgi:hypothetical protein
MDQINIEVELLRFEMREIELRYLLRCCHTAWYSRRTNRQSANEMEQGNISGGRQRMCQCQKVYGSSHKCKRIIEFWAQKKEVTHLKLLVLTG